MPSVVTSRFVACHDRLKEEGKVKSSRQFARALDYLPQNLNEILKGKRDVPLEVIRRGVEVFQINPNYLYSGDGAMFLDEEGADNFRVLTVGVNAQGNERILHVPISAQAGYTQEIADRVFYEDLPAYSLPDKRFQFGSFRSFDVAGDSMLPTLQEGDKVICRYVEPSDWISGIRDHHVYVIVTRSNILVKRVVNNLQRHRHLELISDNPMYKIVRMNIGEIREVWYLNTLVSQFSHSEKSAPAQHTTLQQLEETIGHQSALIKHLQETMNQLMVNS